MAIPIEGKLHRTNPPIKTKKAATVEWIVAFGITLVALTFHLMFMNNAGGLWRDEISTLSLATLPDFIDVLYALEIDSFPVFPSVAIRAWTSMGWGNTDSGLRIFGMLVGIAILGTFWFNASIFSRRSPLFGLFLIGVSPVIIRFGDSIRPYGLGVLFTLITFGLYWKTIFSPSFKNVICATLSGILMVHCLYQNAFILATIGFGAIMVCVCRRKWDRALWIAAMGIFTAISLLPYIDVIKKTSEWTILIKNPETTNLFGAALKAFGSPRIEMIWVWLFLFAAGFVVFIQNVFESGRSKESDEIQSKDSILYAFTVLVFSIGVFLLFLDSTRVYIRPWYYLPIICTSALCLDILMGAIPKMSILRISLVILLTLVFVEDTWRNVKIRQTNVDLIAAQLEKAAQKEDLILTYPWYVGITFGRYFKGSTPWSSVPPMEDLTLTRFDLIKKRMVDPDPMNFLLDRINETFLSGNKIWLVGWLPLKEPDFKLPPFTPAPHPETGWLWWPHYDHYWGIQILDALKPFNKDKLHYSFLTKKKVNPLENARVTSYKGVKKFSSNDK